MRQPTSQQVTIGADCPDCDAPAGRPCTIHRAIRDRYGPYAHHPARARAYLSGGEDTRTSKQMKAETGMLLGKFAVVAERVRIDWPDLTSAEMTSLRWVLAALDVEARPIPEATLSLIGAGVSGLPRSEVRALLRRAVERGLLTDGGRSGYSPAVTA